MQLEIKQPEEKEKAKKRCKLFLTESEWDKSIQLRAELEGGETNILLEIDQAGVVTFQRLSKSFLVKTDFQHNENLFLHSKLNGSSF